MRYAAVLLIGLLAVVGCVAQEATTGETAAAAREETASATKEGTNYSIVGVHGRKKSQMELSAVLDGVPTVVKLEGLHSAYFKAPEGETVYADLDIVVAHVTGTYCDPGAFAGKATSFEAFSGGSYPTSLPLAAVDELELLYDFVHPELGNWFGSRVIECL